MSGVRTFEEMQDELKLNLGERTDLDNHTDLGDLLGVWINEAYLTLTTRNNLFGVKLPIEFTFPELDDRDTSQSTTDGTAYIDTPSDALLIHTVHDYTNDKKLTKFKDIKNYVELTDRSDSDAEGKPTKWIRYGSYIWLWPTPDSDSYTMYIWYRKKPALLTGTNTTVIGSEWDEAIVQLATYHSLIRLRDYESANIWKSLFTENIIGLVGIYDKEQRDTNDHLRPHPAYNDWKYR